MGLRWTLRAYLGAQIGGTTPSAARGTPAGQLEGGVTQQIISELEIECLPNDIPGHLDLDVSALNIGDTLHVTDLEVGDITILTSLDSTIVTVAGAAPEEEEIVEEELLEGEEGEEGEEGTAEGGVEGSSEDSSSEGKKE